MCLDGDVMSANQPNEVGKSSVLLVEDDAQTCVAMRMLLQHYGYDVLLAGTVAEGVRMLAQRPQYLLLDLMLPDGDGARVLEHVRQRQLPMTVAVITGSNDPKRMRHVNNLKPDIFMRKPIDFIELLSQIRAGKSPALPVQ